MRIYLAGKMPVREKRMVERNLTDLHFFDMSEEDEELVRSYEVVTDWRWSIAKDLEGALAHAPHWAESSPDDLEHHTGVRQRDFSMMGGHEYGGPFYKTQYMGHGCYDYKSDLHGHGNLSDEFKRFKRMQTFFSCYAQIERSDAVFAWVDDFDLFGTFCELGMAHAMHKPIIIGTPSTVALDEEIWFPLESATYRITAESAVKAFEAFLINYAPKITADLAMAKAKATESELANLKRKIAQISDGKSAAWRELVKELGDTK